MGNHSHDQPLPDPERAGRTSADQTMKVSPMTTVVSLVASAKPKASADNNNQRWLVRPRQKQYSVTIIMAAAGMSSVANRAWA